MKIPLIPSIQIGGIIALGVNVCLLKKLDGLFDVALLERAHALAGERARIARHGWLRRRGDGSNGSGHRCDEAPPASEHRPTESQRRRASNCEQNWQSHGDEDCSECL